MERIAVFGCCGSGKTTLSRDLHNITGLPLIHLDREHYLPGWQEMSKEEWRNRHSELISDTQWIIDGNYQGTLDARLERADTVIYLDYPTWKCLYRVVKRYFKYRGKVREDMRDGCKEKLDGQFISFIMHYRKNYRKAHYYRLEKCRREGKQVYIFKKDKEATAFLEALLKDIK